MSFATPPSLRLENPPSSSQIEDVLSHFFSPCFIHSTRTQLSTHLVHVLPSPWIIENHLLDHTCPELLWSGFAVL